MTRSTSTTTPKTPDVFDVLGTTITQGTPVTVRLLNGQRITGTLHGVTHRDGVAYTVSVHDGHQFRQAYASTLAVKS